jgi:hypothetical protein
VLLTSSGLSPSRAQALDILVQLQLQQHAAVHAVARNRLNPVDTGGRIHDGVASTAS